MSHSHAGPSPWTDLEDNDVVVDLMAARLNVTIGTLREVRAITDQHDAPTSDLLNGIVRGLEKHRWLLRATRTPGRPA